MTGIGFKIKMRFSHRYYKSLMSVQLVFHSFKLVESIMVTVVTCGAFTYLPQWSAWCFELNNVLNILTQWQIYAHDSMSTSRETSYILRRSKYSTTLSFKKYLNALQRSTCMRASTEHTLALARSKYHSETFQRDCVKLNVMTINNILLSNYTNAYL